MDGPRFCDERAYPIFAADPLQPTLSGNKWWPEMPLCFDHLMAERVELCVDQFTIGGKRGHMIELAEGFQSGDPQW